MANACGALLLVCAALGASSAFASNESVFGIWATQYNNGRVVIEPCGAAICGHVLDGDQLRANPGQTDIHNPDRAKQSRRVKGLRILEGYRGGPIEWRGGTVYDPRTGNQSSDSYLTLLAPDTLQVKGCRWVVCRSEILRRLHDDAAANAANSPAAALRR